MKEKHKKLIRNFKKWLILTSIIVICVVFQSSKILSSLLKIKPLLIFPLTISFSMFFDIKNIAIFTIICGFFNDCFSDRIFGISSIIFVISNLIVSFICQKFVRIRMLNYVIIVACLNTITEFLKFMFIYCKMFFYNIWPLWISTIFPKILTTTLICPIFFLISKKIFYIFDKNKLIETN